MVSEPLGISAYIEVESDKAGLQTVRTAVEQLLKKEQRVKL